MKRMVTSMKESFCFRKKKYFKFVPDYNFSYTNKHKETSGERRHIFYKHEEMFLQTR